MDEFILDVKKAAVEAVAAEKPVAIHFGTVITDAPLTLKINQKTLLKEDCLAFLNGVGSGSPLNIGDVVALARIQGGKRYLVLDRVGYPEYSDDPAADYNDDSGNTESGSSGSSGGNGGSGGESTWKLVRLTGKEIEWLAALIYYESRGMPTACMDLVAVVALNRVKCKKWEFAMTNTLMQVLKVPSQYGYGSPGKTATKIFHGDWTTEYEARQNPSLVLSCRTAAKRVASGASRDDQSGGHWPENVLFQHSHHGRMLGTRRFRTYTNGLYTAYFDIKE